MSVITSLDLKRPNLDASVSVLVSEVPASTTTLFSRHEKLKVNWVWPFCDKFKNSKSICNKLDCILDQNLTRLGGLLFFWLNRFNLICLCMFYFLFVMTLVAHEELAHASVRSQYICDIASEVFFLPQENVKKRPWIP